VQGTSAQASSQEKLKAALADLQSKLQSSAPDLQLSFSVDKDTDRPVVKVVDASTNEVIRQIPSKEILQLDKDIDKMQGLLLDKKA
jgi:flagellar protein FlaG